MTTNNNKHIYKIACIKQLFLDVIFYQQVRFQLYLISHLHSANSTNKRFIHENFLVSRYSSIYMPYYTHTHMYKDSSYNHLCKSSNHLILYTRTDIHHDSILTLNYTHFHSIRIYTHTIHLELKIFFHFPQTLNEILLYSFF